MILTDEGKDYVLGWLKEIARDECIECAEAWFTDAELIAENTPPGDDIIIEVGPYFAKDKRPHTLNLYPDHFEEC